MAKHQGRGKEIDGLMGKMEYRVALTEGAEKRDLVNTNPAVAATLTRRFDESDRLFPGLTFALSSPDIEAKPAAKEYFQASILLGLSAALVVIIGLILTWRAVQRERKVAQLKSDFLAGISHELKTPLTAIRAFGDLLHSGRARNAERIHEYGGLIKTESDRLTALINNILELSRLERGVRRYRLEEGMLCAVVAETVEVFRHSAEAQGFTIALTLPTPPVQASFDKSALRQTLLNLLSNAVRYAGTVRRVEVTVAREQADAVIAVRDYGIGIAASEQRRIFTPFYRAPQSQERGLGIGLAIVREIAEAHGGDISVESELGAGATFRLRLPLIIEVKTSVGQEAPAAPLSKPSEYGQSFSR
ncbi:MAG: HAMP domain-containing sensor histidine kinase [Blastocatellia bacterium]